MSLRMEEGEFGFTFSLSLRDADSTTHSLSGDEDVTVYVTKPGGSGVAIGTATIQDATEGLIYVVIGSGDVSKLTAAKYDIRVKIEGTGQVLIPEPGELLVGKGVL